MVTSLKSNCLNKFCSLRQLAKKMPPQFYVLALLLLCWQWPWQLYFGHFNWIITVTTLQAALVISCNKLTSERWVTAVIMVELSCMLINATLFYFDLHKEPYQEQIMLAAFIIELLIIITSMGVGVGRIRNDRLHCNKYRMVSGFNNPSSISGSAEAAV